MTNRTTAAAIFTIALACTGCSSTGTTSQSSSTISGESSPGANDAITIFRLQHVDASATASKLQAEHASAKIIADAHTNSVVVSASPEQQTTIRAAIERMDQPG